MAIIIPKTFWQIFVSLLAAALLLWAVLAGLAAGKSQAQAWVISSNSAAIAQGLKYFYNDEERFPSAVEFQSDKNLLQSYLSSFPPAQFPSPQCQQSFAYERPSLPTFHLAFCLPAAFNGYKAGWNLLDQSSFH